MKALCCVAGDALDLTVLEQKARGDARSGCTTAAMGVVLGVSAVDVACARALICNSQASPRLRHYRERTGFPKPAQQMRGAARANFQPPPDMRVPLALRPLRQSMTAVSRRTDRRACHGPARLARPSGL